MKRMSRKMQKEMKDPLENPESFGNYETYNVSQKKAIFGLWSRQQENSIKMIQSD